MQPNPNQAHSHTHGQPHGLGHEDDHAHGHSHAHGHAHGHDLGHDHGHSHAHDHAHGPVSLLAPQQTKDLKSPVLSGLAQRLLWVTSLLVVLWLAVFWALRAHG
jgi:hypothetical protein